MVNVSDAKASRDPQDVLVTYSLGSCIGVALYDPAARIGGLLHFQLPNSGIDPQRAQQHPLMFADTGMESLLNKLHELGAVKSRLKVRLAGAAQMLGDSNLFNIGRRNHASIRKILWQSGLLIEGEDVGGSSPRNMYLNLADGQVMIKAGGKTLSL
ncbi:MAG: chemotaxis protein CheD [Bacillota bacterium]